MSNAIINSGAVGTAVTSIYTCPTPAQKKAMKSLGAMNKDELQARIGLLQGIIGQCDAELAKPETFDKAFVAGRKRTAVENLARARVELARR